MFNQEAQLLLKQLALRWDQW